MNVDLSVGDLVKVMSNSHPEIMFVLIIGEKQHICNSDGEEWWVEWRGKNVKTDKYFNVSSRYHKYEKI